MTKPKPPRARTSFELRRLDNNNAEIQLTMLRQLETAARDTRFLAARSADTFLSPARVRSLMAALVAQGYAEPTTTPGGLPGWTITLNGQLYVAQQRAKAVTPGRLCNASMGHTTYCPTELNYRGSTRQAQT